MSKAGPTAVFLIGLAVKMKALATKQYRYTPLFNLLLKKFKQTTGGQLQLCVSGGGAVSSQGTGACELAGDDGPTGEIAISGAISGEVQEWVRTALDAPLAQGYGLTRASRRG